MGISSGIGWKNRRHYDEHRHTQYLSCRIAFAIAKSMYDSTHLVVQRFPCTVQAPVTFVDVLSDILVVLKADMPLNTYRRVIDNICKIFIIHTCT